jgi:PhnB protein
MKAINPYFSFPGTSEAAFAFYRSVFGGEFAVLVRYGDTPMGAQTPAAERNRVMHVSLPLKNGTVLMASDACEGMGKPLVVGNNVSVSIHTDSEAETTALYNGLSAGGSAGMAPQKMFWGDFWGTCTDRFGVQWMVSYTYPRPAGA